MDPTIVLTASGFLAMLASSTFFLYTWFTTDTLEEDY
jgi:hypothetical protein